jgi:hypothetical protein
VGGVVYYGDMFVRQRAVTNKVFSQFEFVVGQMVEKVSDTEVIVNYFVTGEVAIKTCLPETDEIIVPCASLRTNIYQKCKTSEFQSLAYVMHGNLKTEIFVDPEGLLNTYAVTCQYVVECNPSTIPYPKIQYLPRSVDVYRRMCPRLPSVHC